MERDDVEDPTADAPARAQRTRSRWKKLRAATLVFLLLRRRVRHDKRHSNKQQQHKRMPTSVFFAKPFVQAATAAAAQRLWANPLPAAASPQVTRWFEQKMQLFERLVRKPTQCRDDVDIKILGDFIRHTKFFYDLTSASIDALAQVLRFRTCHEGEVLHLQGSPVQDTSGRYLVVTGSLLVYKNAQYSLRAREGEDYTQWFLANTPGATHDAIRYGECIETCSAGEITGNDATLEHLFRQHSVISQVKTVVALVTQADYKRVVRFNVDNETQLLDTVREILTPPKVIKQSPHQTTVNEPPRPDLSPQQVRIIMRFIGRFKCFRVLPYQFCMEMVSKLQILTVKGDEVFSVSSDDSPSMIMVLDGRLCVHVCESHESQRLRFVCREVDHAGGRSHPTSKKPVNLEATEYLPGCEAGSNVESSVGTNSLHICSLAAGDSFGELAISSTETTKQGASIYQPFTASGHMAATVVRVSRHHYMAALQRYIETVDFNLATVSSILSRSLPQDRTDEQVQYMKTFFLLRSSARLFFSQLPGQVLESVLLHAGIESKVVHEEIGEFIQKEGSTVESMKIVLNGYVGVFKSTAKVANPLFTDTGVNGTPTPPTRAVLRRYQSRLIRANTHILDTDGGMHIGRLASAQRTARALPKVVIPELQESDREDAHAIDPISVLPSGAAFGHLQILTGQLRSLYSYAAFASGSGALDDTRSGAVTDVGHRIHLLSIPARFVHLYLASLDDQILYNPLRAIKRLQHEGLSLGANEAVPVSTIRRLQLSRLLTRNMAFAGIPKRAASSMIEDMEVVRAEPRRVIYEVGTPIQRALFVVLSGSVRVFSYSSKAKTGRDRRGSLLPGYDEKKTKLPRRISQNAPGSRQEEAAACGEWPVSFSKSANDSIFLSDYNRTTELVCGDVFGRHETHIFAKPRTRRLSTGPSGSTRQASPQIVHVDNVVSMTDCLLAVVPRRDQQCELSCGERRLLMRVIDDRGDSKWRGKTDRIDEDDSMASAGTFDSLALSFHVLDSMDLMNQISTHDRVLLANRLRYMKLAPGETVYMQGEPSEAIYFVLFGSVTLFTKGHSDVAVDPGTRESASHDVGYPLFEVMEGEVFGDESFERSHGCSRRCTAVATVEDTAETVLVYITRSHFESVVDGKSTPTFKDSARQGESTLRVGQRKSSAKERWKMAVSQVIQLRAQRSQWPTVLAKARNHRIDLLFDLVKQLPAFEDTPATSTKNLCSNAMLQTFTQDTTIYNKSDTTVDTCFLVLQGSVTLYQTYYGSGAASTSVASTTLLPQGDNSIRVTIQAIEAGELFGEFEMMEGHPRRHINAIVGAPGTKIVIIQQEDYFAHWPKRDQNEGKLSMLKAQLRNLCRLDPDQLCSLYYGMKERTFRRREVITGSKEQAGFLHVIQEGECVVHDAVVLKQKSSETTRLSPTKLSLDTRVSTVGPGAILFADQPDVPLPIDIRRASTRSVDITEMPAPPEALKTTQYVVVDSPTVTTFSVQLFSRRTLAMQRQPDLLAVFLLGKSGLQVIRDTVEMQVKWRADTVAQTGRLVAHSFSQSGDRVVEFAMNRVDVEADERLRKTKPTMHKDIAKALLRHDAGCESPRNKGNPHKPTPPSPRQHRDASLMTPSQPVTIGSFSPTRKTSPHQPLLIRERASPVLSAPILLPSLTSSATVGSGSVSLQSPRCETLNSGGCDRDEQLRKEERVLLALANPSPRQDVLTKAQQQQMRRRHGRPPPKRVENSSEFVDEHAVTPMAHIRTEHERKKAGLCRRLLHVKGVIER